MILKLWSINKEKEEKLEIIDKKKETLKNIDKLILVERKV